MREPGIPKLLTWRWAPCAALVLGAFSFCAFMLLAIPDHIGSIEPQGGPGLRLGNQLSRTQTSPPSESWGSSAAQASEQPEASAASPANHLASRASGAFPKRGFTPPLDRPAAPAQAAPPPPPAPAAPPPAPTPEAQPPAPEAAPVPPPADPVAAAQTPPPAN